MSVPFISLFISSLKNVFLIEVFGAFLKIFLGAGLILGGILIFFIKNEGRLLALSSLIGILVIDTIIAVKFSTFLIAPIVFLGIPIFILLHKDFKVQFPC